MTTIEGLLTVAEHRLQPDLISVDAEHSYAAAATDIELAYRLFPQATLVGDDYDWEGAARAVNEFAMHHRRTAGVRGWRIADRRVGPTVERGPQPGRMRSVVLMPYLNGIDWECEQGLRELEGHGVRVVRRGGLRPSTPRGTSWPPTRFMTASSQSCSSIRTLASTRWTF